MNRGTDHNGFTLIELLISMAISMLVITAGFIFYQTQFQSRITQERVTDMQQNLRAAMSMMGGDIRMAGYDPGEKTKAGIVEAKISTVTFSLSLDADANGRDDDGDKTVDEDDEAGLFVSITYALGDLDKDGDLDLIRTVGTKSVAVAENIEAMELNYMMEDGTFSPAPTDLKRVMAVRIALLARSMREDSSFTNSVKYTGYTKAWDSKGDGYRRRLLRCIVRCRNRGI